MASVADRLNKARMSYNYCTCCGRQPKNDSEEPNYAPLRYWDSDDGWKIGTLCRWCAEELLDAKPKPGDFAYKNHRDDACSGSPETDEDPAEALGDYII